MVASPTSGLFKITTAPALLFALLSLVLALVTFRFGTGAAVLRGIAFLTTIVLPDALATWWLVHRLSVLRTPPDARRGATAFAFSAPVVLAVGYVLGEWVGGYVEVLLGRVFILPAVFGFIAVLMATIPALVVIWALHPSAGVDPVHKGSQ